jgi:WhiB family redox-sensing transcriptional regulator
MSETIMRHREVGSRANQLNRETIQGELSGPRVNYPVTMSNHISPDPTNGAVDTFVRFAVACFDSCDLIGRPACQASAACRGMGTEIFFPITGDTVFAATRICSRCPVSSECHSVALADPSLHGIWAGTSVRGREVLRTAFGLASMGRRAEVSVSKPAIKHKLGE